MSGQQLVADYLSRLRSAAGSLPTGQRQELVGEIEAHIAEASGRRGYAESDVRNVLDRLGPPEEIVAAAGGGVTTAAPPPAYERRGTPLLEIAALILLLVGGLVVPVVGWLAGVALLWSSRIWTVRDKLLGTLVVPGGLGLVALGGLASLVMVSGGCVSSASLDSAGVSHSSSTCSPPSALHNGLLIALMVLMVIAPVTTVAYLGRRLTRPVAARL